MKKFNLIRLFVFCLSVYSLSIFFESGRLLAYEKTFTHLGTSIFSGFIFVLSLLTIGFWVYSEEKEKNNLKIKFGLYEWLYNFPINVIARSKATKQSPDVSGLPRRHFVPPRNDNERNL